MLSEVTILVTLGGGENDKEGMARFWGTGNVQFLDLSAVHECVQFMSIHQAIHLQHMYFLVCILYANKKLKTKIKTT